MTVTVEIHDLGLIPKKGHREYKGKICGRGARWVRGDTFTEVLGTLLLRYRHRFIGADAIVVIDVTETGQRFEV